MNPTELDNFLSLQSYIVGFSYSYADLTLFNKIKDKCEDYQNKRHVLRWIHHIKILSANDKLVLCDSKSPDNNLKAGIAVKLYIMIY